MQANGVNPMGRFSVELVVANNTDLENASAGRIKPEEVRRETIQGVVDSGAKHLVLPLAVAQRLGLASGGTTRVRYADNHIETRDTVKGVYAEIMGRKSTFRAIVEPKRDSALVGAIVLEDLDFLVDCSNQRLVPRDPKGELSEIE